MFALNTHKPLPLTATPPRKVCILRLSAIGDAVHTLAVVREFQHAWPDTEFTWIIGRIEAMLLGDIPNIRFLIYDKKADKAVHKQFYYKLRQEKFDLLLHMQVSLRASKIARHVKAPIKLGFDCQRAKDFQWLFTTHRIPHQPQQHVMDGLMGFAQHCGIQTRDKPEWNIPLSPNDLKFAQPYSGALVISPCSSMRARNFRNWSAENYAAVADCAIEHYQLPVVLTGGNTPLEQEYGQTISKLMRHSAHNLIGQTSLKELLAVLAAAQAFLGPDSGPAHMANAMGTPVIGLYATSNPARTGPYNRQYVINEYPNACQQFLNKTPDKLSWGQRVRDADAMALIAIQDAIGMLDSVMSPE